MVVHKTHGSYIPSIDGLRALSVISVIIYHFDESFLPGGYLGVDIFFVISGFVVATSLKGREFGTFLGLMAYFYARRLLRIMPALLVMLTLTGLATALFVPSAWLSSQNEAVGKYAFLGLSNIKLALSHDAYFSPRTAFNPYVHTWSLGVEEQFYLLFPILFYLLYAKKIIGRQLAVFITFGLIVASLALAAFWNATGSQQLAFYMMPSRFWELGIGVALALSWREKLTLSRRTTTLVSVASLVVIVLSFSLPLSEYSPFPASIPTVLAATALIAISVSRPESHYAKAMSSPVPVGIGKASYSLYLWHWPVFVLFRWTIGLDTTSEFAAALAVMSVFSFISYRYVEGYTRHLRVDSVWLRAGAIAGVVGVSLFSLATYVWIAQHKGQISQSVTSREDLWFPGDQTPFDARSRVCDKIDKTKKAFYGGEITTLVPDECAAGRPTRKFVAVGDSHNLVYIPNYRRLAMDTGAEIQTYFKSGCPFLEFIRSIGQRPDCVVYFNKTVERLVATLSPNDTLFLPSLRMARFHDQWGEVNPGPLRYEAAFAEAETVMRRLTQTGARIVFEAPTPVLPSPAFRCTDWFNRMNPICEKGMTVGLSDVDAQRATVVSNMRTLSSIWPNVGIWDPTPVLCPNGRCAAIAEGGMPMFFDGDHISGYANTVLYPKFRSIYSQ